MRIGTTRPYPPTGLNSAAWRDVPLQFVRFADLTTTQDGIYLHALFERGRSVSGDVFPHVVAWGGGLFLEDGHTRVARQHLQGYGGALMRLWVAR